MGSSKARLQIDKRRPHRLVSAAASGAIKNEVGPERLRAIVRFGNRLGNPLVDCIVDTGAYLTAIPEDVWSPIAQQIVWLNPEPAKELPRWLSRISGIGGGGYPCKPGLIDIEIVGLNLHSLSARPVIALFVQDAGLMKDVLLGLGGFAFSGRHLAVDYDGDGAWMMDVSQ
jgi:hypothetical protein